LTDPTDPISFEPFEKKFLGRVIERNPGHQEALVRLAALMTADNKKEDAIALLEAATALAPENLAALRLLANLYTEVGRHRDGFDTDHTIVRLAPDDATARYNLACSLALMERRDEALDELARAVELGFRNAQHMREDADLGSLHGDERFEAILRSITKPEA